MVDSMLLSELGTSDPYWLAIGIWSLVCQFFFIAVIFRCLAAPANNDRTIRKFPIEVISNLAFEGLAFLVIINGTWTGSSLEYMNLISTLVLCAVGLCYFFYGILDDDLAVDWRHPSYSTCIRPPAAINRPSSLSILWCCHLIESRTL